MPFLSTNWPFLALILVLLGALGVQQVRVSNLKTVLAEERRAHIAQRLEWSQVSEAAEREALRALSDATERAEREYWTRLAELESTTEELRNDVLTAEAERDAWRVRFEQNKRGSMVCQRWAEEKVQCPVE